MYSLCLVVNREYNYPESLVEKYNGLSLDDLSMTKEVLHPEKLTWIIIGDAEKIKAELKPLSLDLSVFKV